MTAWGGEGGSFYLTRDREQPQVLAYSVVPHEDRADLKDVNALRDTGLIANAHKAASVGHSLPFRSETSRLADIIEGDPLQERLHDYRLGTDGVLNEFSVTAATPRKAYNKPVRL
ncbi:hypothetical protein [uncultured Comamonas sp.]|uniref:hypothetical protein n=1 Tax=uncultured Comamonas sp. TaxID=114710 RepID=UPI0025EEA79F|nr:hypothetical protein [uncultured Comamonas sp.]